MFAAYELADSPTSGFFSDHSKLNHDDVVDG